MYIYIYTLCILRKPAEGSGWRVCIGRSYGEANLGGGGAGGSGKFSLWKGEAGIGWGNGEKALVRRSCFRGGGSALPWYT